MEFLSSPIDVNDDGTPSHLLKYQLYFLSMASTVVVEISNMSNRHISLDRILAGIFMPYTFQVFHCHPPLLAKEGAYSMLSLSVRDSQAFNWIF